MLLVPLGSVGMVAFARSPQAVGPTAAKLADYATGDLATTHLLVCAQVLSVAALAAGGFFVAWSFGRELESGTAGALFGLAVPRGTIALAKCLVALAWVMSCVVLTVAVTAAASAVVTAASGEPFAAWAGMRDALLAGLLGGGLALPFAWVATVTRSQLGTVGALVGMVALTQIVVLLGGGTWFPYAAPSLWAGMGGADAAADVGLPTCCSRRRSLRSPSPPSCTPGGASRTCEAPPRHSPSQARAAPARSPATARPGRSPR